MAPRLLIIVGDRTAVSIPLLQGRKVILLILHQTTQWKEITEYGVAMMDIANITETTNEKDVMYLKDRGEAAKAYYQFATQREKSFLDAAYEVAKEKGLVQVFTAGNRSLMAESFTRASFTLFPSRCWKILGKCYWSTGRWRLSKWWDANQQMVEQILWLRKWQLRSRILGYQIYNYAGDAKWWTIAAPATNIYSAYVHIMNEDELRGSQ